MPHILSCSRPRNNQIELRKRQIQKYKNTENEKLNSNKNIVEKKTETWKTLEDYILYNFKYFISGTVKLHTDDIDNKSVVFRIKENSHYSGLKKERKVFNKEKIAKIMVG